MVEKTPSAPSVLDEHYRSLAEDYDRFLYYSPKFVRTLTTKMIEHLELEVADMLADIGCGTGMYSLDILEQVPMEQPVLGVDPYPEMLSALPEEAHIKPIVADALSFSRQDHRYNKVLVKEAIHHVDERDEFFANIFHRLPEGGRMLLVHVPPDVQYPLFEAALERCLSWHADPEVLSGELKDAGFTVTRDAVDYRHELPRDLYFQMVENCYMSVLTSFEEEELRAGLDEMEQRYGDRETLIFIDHFDYLTAVK